MRQLKEKLNKKSLSRQGEYHSLSAFLFHRKYCRGERFKKAFPINLNLIK